MEAIIPDREAAQQRGWKFQVQWADDGKPCFYRCGSGTEADDWADRLRRQGKTPIVYDLRELLQLH